MLAYSDLTKTMEALMLSIEVAGTGDVSFFDTCFAPRLTPIQARFETWKG